MSTSPASEPVTGVISFTAQGEAALDGLAATIVARCDGTPESIAEVLDEVLGADIEQLANALTATADQRAEAHDLTEPARDHGLAPEAESPDEAARRRLGEGRDVPPAGSKTGPERAIRH
jgi:hypothetical protein